MARISTVSSGLTKKTMFLQDKKSKVDFTVGNIIF